VRKLEEWFDLFSDDVLYFMPRRKNVPRRELHRELTPLGDLAILEEDRGYLEMRVAWLDAGMAWAGDPPSRTLHLIGNLDGAAGEGKTAFLVYRSHLETDHQLLSGCREDAAEGGSRGEGGQVHDRPRRQRPARQKSQRLSLESKPNQLDPVPTDLGRSSRLTTSAGYAPFASFADRRASVSGEWTAAIGDRATDPHLLH
jgi:3-phenylpropionate/cinnamic acid dioxygenase small subunit